MKTPQESKEFLQALEVNRNELLTEVIDSMPSMRITMSIMPGEYWFFHPGWFNLRWWWEELIGYTDTVQEAIVHILVQYVHLCEISQTLTFLSKKHKLIYRKLWNDRSFREYYQEQTKMRDRYIDDAATRLFSLREKISWLCFCALGATCGITAHPHKVSFYQMLDAVRNVAPPLDFKHLITQIRNSLERLDKDDFRNLMRIRHAIVHRSRAALDETPSPMILPLDRNTWDSIDLGGSGLREMVHLIITSWSLILQSLRELGRAAWPTLPFRLEVPADSDLVPDLKSVVGRIQLVHLGAGVRCDEGQIIIKCMKHCDGFVGQFDIAPGQDFNDPVTRQKIHERSTKLMRTIIPEYEPERMASYSKCLYSIDSKYFIQLMRKEDEWITRHETATDFLERITEAQLEDPNYERRFFEPEEGLKLAKQTRNWPKKVRQIVVQDVIPKGGSNNPPFVRQYSRSRRAKYHVMFPTKLLGQARKLGSKKNIVFFEASELVDRR
jgi:hypothetical protein